MLSAHHSWFSLKEDGNEEAIYACGSSRDRSAPSGEKLEPLRTLAEKGLKKGRAL